MARSAGLPLAESPPVSAMPKPILIGSAARAVNAPALASSSATTTAPPTVHAIDRLPRAVAVSRGRQAGRTGEDRPAVLRHREVVELPLHPHLVADANAPDASGHGRVGRDEVVIGYLLEVEGWGESPGPAAGAGEFSAHVLHLPIRPVGDRLPPDDADVLDVAGIRLVADVDQRVAPVLRDDQPRNIVAGPGRGRVGSASDGCGEAGPT